MVRPTVDDELHEHHYGRHGTQPAGTDHGEGVQDDPRVDRFEPHSRTVLIGPNGAGKSNFISFFRMMSWGLSGPDKLTLHVSQQGGSRRLLHDGPAHTREIEAELTIRTAAGENDYAFRLFHAAGDTLVFADERYRFSRTGWQGKANWKTLGAGHKDPQLLAAAVDVVVERPDRASTFKRLDPVALHRWLEMYSLSELWEKNIIGGRP